MAESVGCAGVAATLSKSDLDRWTENEKNVLDSPRARKKFNDFLLSRSFDDASLTLKFWEKCNNILLESGHDENLKKGGPLNMNNISHARLHKNYSALIDFAIENVNFDAYELRCMRASLATKDVCKILNTIEQTQNSASHLLRDEFLLFREWLRKQSNVTKHLPNAGKK